MMEERIEQIFLKELQVEVPDRQTDVIDTGLIDSLTFVQLLSVLEREFEVQIELDQLELDDFRTVTSIAGFLEQRRGATGGVTAVAGD